MTRYAANVAHGIVTAITSQVTGLSAVVASFLVGAVSGNVAGFVAIVAETGIVR